jgi:hypothetical protein
MCVVLVLWALHPHLLCCSQLPCRSHAHGFIQVLAVPLCKGAADQGMKLAVQELLVNSMSKGRQKLRGQL